MMEAEDRSALVLGPCSMMDRHSEGAAKGAVREEGVTEAHPGEDGATAWVVWVGWRPPVSV